MPIPDLSLTIKNGGLGLVPQLNSNVVACAGVCSAGVANTVYSFGAGNVQLVKDTLGTGPLAEQVAMLVQAGLSVIAVKVTTTTPGSQGAVTRTGTSTSVCTTTGTALDSYDVVVKFIKSGTNNLGDSAFQYSLDGGLTFSPAIALPVATTYLIPGTGITLNFAAGSLVSGDTFTFTATGPVFGNSDLNTALTALFASPLTWFLLSVVGVPVDAASMQTFFATIDTQLSAAAAAFRYVRGIMAAPWGLTDAALLVANQALVSDRLMIAVDWARGTSALDARQAKFAANLFIARRLGQITIGTDAAQVVDGPLTGLTAINRDEAATPGLDQGRYSTLRTFIGLPGFYITNARFCSSPTSDYQYAQLGRVMDVACAILRTRGLRFLNSSLVVDKTTGFILETEARKVEGYVESGERAVLTQPGQASDVSVLVNRTNNILSTQQLLVDVRVVPLAAIKAVVATIGFFNPALNPS